MLGIEITPEIIRVAKDRVRGAESEVTDIKSWITSDGQASYDSITVYFNLIANLTQDGIRSTIWRISSWLRSGGITVFATAPMQANNADIKRMGGDIVVRGMNVEDFGQWFRKIGFEVVKEEESTCMPKGVEAG